MRPAVGIAVVAMTLLTASPRDLSAQDSQFGIRGLGTPGRWESVRARSSGGAFAPFDALSPLMEAPLADISTLTATAAGGTSHRDAQLGDTITQLRATRFPLMGVAGRVAPRLVVAGGFTTYLDRSWDVTLRDSTVLRGELERYRDEITSDGSVGERAHRRGSGADHRGLGARGQPAARPGRRLDRRADRSAAHGGRRVAPRPEPPRPVRRVGGVALLVERRSGRVRHVELVRGSRVRLRPHADPSGGAWPPAAVRAGNQGADGARGVGGNGSGVRAGPGAHRPGRRAAGASRGDPHRARVDRARGADRAAVNVYFHTFGCKANQYDTALVRQAFADQGVVVVDDPAAADLAVVNSCTVTHESEVKLGRLVRRLARRGGGGGGGGGGRLETVVMGCAAARDSGAIAALPSVRAVVGGADPTRVLEAAGFRAPRVDTVLRRFPANARGWLKIQDGCDEHCTFCATTIARGANRARTT